MNKQDLNIKWEGSDISKEYRATQKSQQPCLIWFTGLSGAGKSSIARRLDGVLASKGRHTYLLDGDNLRHGLNKDLGFSDQDRSENVRRISEAGKLLVDAGLIVIAASISPFARDRKAVRDLFEPGEFVEVYVCTSLSVCEARDPKGLYRRARSGEIANFTGIDSDYEQPSEPELIIDTEFEQVDHAVSRIEDFLQKAGVI